RRAGAQSRPGHATAGREACAHQRLLAVAGDGREDQLVGLLVEHEDRGGRGPEDAAGDDRHGQQHLSVRLLPRQAAGRQRSPRFAAHRPASASALFAVCASTVFICTGVSIRCAERISATMPDRGGAAKLLPVSVILPPPNQATSTPIPRAKNSTGGAGLTK